MIRFKTFLKEHLSNEQLMKFSSHKLTPEAHDATDHFFGSATNHEIHEPIEGTSEKSEVHKAVERHIGKEITHDEYHSGITSDPKYPTRNIKLGKMIKDPDLLKQFASDETRASKNTSRKNMTMRVVRGVHVAGQTNGARTPEQPNGHSWADASCKNVDSGVYRNKLPAEIKYGTVVCFAKDHTGQEVYRATLHPHLGKYKNGGTVYALDSEYGIKNPAFTAHAHNVASRLSAKAPITDNIYTKHPLVYNDSGVNHITHPNLEPHHIDSMIDKTIAKKEYSDKLSTVLQQNHKSINSEHLHKIIMANLNNGYDKGVDYHLKYSAIQHPKLSSKTKDAILDGDDDHVKKEFIKSGKMEPHHIDRIIKDDKPGHIESMLYVNQKLSPKQIHSVLDKGDHRLSRRMIRQDNFGIEHVERLIGEKDRLAAERFINPNIIRGIKDHHLQAIAKNAAENGHFNVLSNDRVMSKMSSEQKEQLFSHRFKPEDDQGHIYDAMRKHFDTETHPKHIMNALNGHYGDETRDHVASNSEHLNDEHLKHIAHHDELAKNILNYHANGEKSEEYRNKVIEHNPNNIKILHHVSSHLVDKYHNHPDQDIVMHIARHGDKLKSTIFNSLMKHPNPEVQKSLARNFKLTVKQQTELSNHPNHEVREKLAMNWALPTNIRNKLLKDPHPDVRETAQTHG